MSDIRERDRDYFVSQAPPGGCRLSIALTLNHNRSTP